MKKILLFIVCLLTISACTIQSSHRTLIEKTRESLVDANATDLTAILFHNLKEMTGKYVVYGQHNYEMDGRMSDTSYWRNEPNRCDAYDVTGSYPAMASFDFLHYTNPESWETKDLEYIRRKFYSAYHRGNVLTFCWHYYNPVTNNNFYDTTRVVDKILPNGTHHEIFKRDLNIIANFAHSVKNDKGELIPIIFRPWHEFDGNWFWWGKNHCTADEFKELYRFTVRYLRDSLHVHNFLYAFSPDCRFETETEYLERYPGDDYVDVVGMDDYWDFRPDGGDRNLVLLKSRILSRYAKTHNKLAAITETGTQARDSLWYSHLLDILKSDGVNLSYLCTWSGFTPFKGHPAEEDFCNFKEDSLILFADEMPDVYAIRD